MMRISFSPQRRDDRLTLSRSGDALTINGAALDLSGVPEGAILPRDAIASEWIARDVRRVDGRLHVCLLLPTGRDPSQAVAFPADSLDPPDGPIAVPHDLQEA